MEIVRDGASVKLVFDADGKRIETPWHNTYVFMAKLVSELGGMSEEDAAHVLAAEDREPTPVKRVIMHTMAEVFGAMDMPEDANALEDQIVSEAQGQTEQVAPQAMVQAPATEEEIESIFKNLGL